MSRRIALSDAAHSLPELVERINREHTGFDLEQDDRIVARLLPGAAPEPMPVSQLNAFFASLPRLGDDTEQFAEDVRRIRRQTGISR